MTTATLHDLLTTYPAVIEHFAADDDPLCLWSGVNIYLDGTLAQVAIYTRDPRNWTLIYYDAATALRQGSTFGGPQTTPQDAIRHHVEYALHVRASAIGEYVHTAA
ncbi:hypothetical protein AB0395_34880 [Streptosporangium sp. NPDC051023]|uniref:hypothetical protein n=1 Tax=Streptosporangium sp. NPDC051023 TaxID=3155410 RepID=UPI00344C6EEB